jgi:hypothetical protein
MSAAIHLLLGPLAALAGLRPFAVRDLAGA